MGLSLLTEIPGLFLLDGDFDLRLLVGTGFGSETPPAPAPPPLLRWLVVLRASEIY